MSSGVPFKTIVLRAGWIHEEAPRAGAFEWLPAWPLVRNIRPDPSIRLGLSVHPMPRGRREEEAVGDELTDGLQGHDDP